MAPLADPTEFSILVPPGFLRCAEDFVEALCGSLPPEERRRRGGIAEKLHTRPDPWHLVFDAALGFCARRRELRLYRELL